MIHKDFNCDKKQLSLKEAQPIGPFKYISF